MLLDKREIVAGLTSVINNSAGASSNAGASARTVAIYGDY